MVKSHRPRIRAGAATLAATVASGVVMGLTVVLPHADAMVMQSSLGTTEEDAARYNKRVLALVNQARENHGLRPVRSASCASTNAHRWSARLVRRDEFQHSDLGVLLNDCSATYASENIALVWDGARPGQLVRLWMNSEGHRANILSPRARLSGVSVRWDDNRNSWIAVQNFVRR